MSRLSKGTSRLVSGWLAAVWLVSAPPTAADLGDGSRDAARFAALALTCVHQEYPNKIAHVLNGAEDVRPPRALTPAFYGCYDWHSAVHGHWLLARLARLDPDAKFASAGRAALARSLTPGHIAAEVEYLRAPGRTSFERPYGLAWLLQLAAELRGWDDPEAATWAETLAPLERQAAATLAEWIPKLTYPIRIGEHSQTAFAFGLILDWARTAGDRPMIELIERRSRELYAPDRDCPLGYEPSGHDFLSPCLAEADLLRRVMPPEDFAGWLSGFLPSIPRDGSSEWLPVAIVSDPGDPKLAHLDGLNLSRAWMLDGIASALPADDARRGAVEAAAEAHRRAGLTAVTGEHYEGGHWLGSFATYLVTRRGVDGGGDRAARSEVRLQTGDGFELGATFYRPSEAPAPAVVLIHQGGSSRTEWGPFAGRLQAEGYAVLSYDVRGHGESDPVDDIVPLFNDPEAAPRDLLAALEYLRARRAVDAGRLAVVGSSIGSNLACVASSEMGVESAVAISGKTSAVYNLAGRDELAMRSIFHISSAGDQGGRRAEWARELYAATAEPRRLRIVEGSSAHGVSIFDEAPELADEIVDWLAGTLSAP